MEIDVPLILMKNTSIFGQYSFNTKKVHIS